MNSSMSPSSSASCALRRTGASAPHRRRAFVRRDLPCHSPRGDGSAAVRRDEFPREGHPMPTIADVEPVTELLRTLVPAESLAHGALAVVPLVAPQLPEPGWLTLAEAGDRVTIGEVSEGGSVPDVTVNNRPDRPPLPLDGEELVGAKQNRMLNAT